MVTHNIGEGPATRVSLSLPEGIAEAAERERRGQILDEYLADYESRKGPISEHARQRARQFLAGQEMAEAQTHCVGPMADSPGIIAFPEDGPGGLAVQLEQPRLGS